MEIQIIYDRQQDVENVVRTSTSLMQESPVNFLQDILPILISSIALLASVTAPYLLIRYEKVYALNKENKEFLRQVEIYLLEWLNVTAHNARLSMEFLGAVNTVGAVFPKTFQFYDFPPTDVFKSYNIELVNEFYIQTRVLKDFNHHLRMIDKEYSTFRNTAMSGGKLAENSTHFFQEAIESLEKGYPRAIKEMTDLRIKVRILLREVNSTDALRIDKFFGIGNENRFWYKKDLKFSTEEIDAERAVLDKEQAEAKVNSNPSQ